MHKPSQPVFRQRIVDLFTLFTRRPFFILIPILAGAVIGPALAWIGFGAQCAGLIALGVIVVLMLYLGSATVRQWVYNVVEFVREH